MLAQDDQEEGQDYTLRRKGRKSKTCLGRMERAVSLLHCLISHQMFFFVPGVSSFFSPVPRRQMYIFPGSSYGVGYFLFNCVCVCRTQNVLYCTAMTSREQVKCLCPSFSRFWRKVFSCSFFGSEPHTLSLVLLSLLGNVVAKRVFLGGLFSRLFAKAFLRPPFLFLSLLFSKPFAVYEDRRTLRVAAENVFPASPLSVSLEKAQFDNKPKIESAFSSD